MKLDLDCIRDILFTVEDIATLDNKVYFNINTYNCDPKFKRVKTYSYDVLAYHIVQCCLYDFFTECITEDRKSFKIDDLTPKAREFISQIREDSNWNKLKKILKDIGCSSIGSAVKFAFDVIKSNL